MRDHKEAIRQIVGRIAGLASPEREAALSQLLILAGLRRLSRTVEQEVRKMPIYIDITENEVLGPMYERAVQKGEVAILRRLLEKRFGTLPAWAEERLTGRTIAELEDLSVRALDAQSIEDLLK